MQAKTSRELALAATDIASSASRRGPCRSRALASRGARDRGRFRPHAQLQAYAFFHLSTSTSHDHSTFLVFSTVSSYVSCTFEFDQTVSRGTRIRRESSRIGEEKLNTS